MNYNQFPGTNLTVSAMCLGTMTFGGQANEPDSIEMLKYAMTTESRSLIPRIFIAKEKVKRLSGKHLSQ